MFCVNLRRIYILLWLGRVFCTCLVRSSWFIVLLKSLVLFIIESRILQFTTIIFELIIPSFLSGFVSCIMVLWYYMHLYFIIVISAWWFDLHDVSFMYFYLPSVCIVKSKVWDIVQSCFLAHSNNLYLFIGSYNLLTFIVIIDKVEFRFSILLFCCIYHIFYSFIPLLFLYFILSEYFLMYHFIFFNNFLLYLFFSGWSRVYIYIYR